MLNSNNFFVGGDMAKKYNEITILKRLINIQKIHDHLIKNEDVSKYSATDKIAYILWKQSFCRNSDIALAISFYNLYYPEYIEDEAIKLEDFYELPKMYDIQRTRAELQNTEGLFPATEEVQQMRKKRAKELQAYYKDKKRKTLKLFPDYYLYFDESGKTDKYFVLAGVILNGIDNNNAQRLRFNELKKNLAKKHNLNVEEIKFASINSRNIAFYKEFIDTVFADGVSMTFLSIIVENCGLKQKTSKNKSEELLKILLKELTSIIVRGTCGSPYADTKAKINIILDKDGAGFDAVERENIQQNLDAQLKQTFKYLIELNNLIDVDSKEDILVQFADLYASSINNVFSNVKADSETSKCKKEFAKHLLSKIGLQDIKKEYPSDKSTVKFINKFIPTT